MTEKADRRSVAYVDLESARRALEAAGLGPVELGEKVAAFTRAHGRMLGAFVYGDLSADEARELSRHGCEARLTSELGEGSSPESVALALDAAEALGARVLAHTVVLVTDDPQLGDLCRRWRRLGACVVLVAPEAHAGEEPARSSDRSVTLEALLAGSAAPEPLAEPRREPKSRERAPVDLDRYDWTKLVLLLRDLEAKMPFVGMRWLKNKVLGPHNVGLGGIAEKQALLNRAVDDGLLETYRVGNRDEQGEPVSACRLKREHPAVKAILDAHPAPSPAAPVEEAG